MIFFFFICIECVCVIACYLLLWASIKRERNTQKMKNMNSYRCCTYVQTQIRANFIAFINNTFKCVFYVHMSSCSKGIHIFCVVIEKRNIIRQTIAHIYVKCKYIKLMIRPILYVFGHDWLEVRPLNCTGIFFFSIFNHNVQFVSLCLTDTYINNLSIHLYVK